VSKIEERRIVEDIEGHWTRENFKRKKPKENKF
jgi:hypothetical protein